MSDNETLAAWDRALGRYGAWDSAVSLFNHGLLTTLRPRWGSAVRPDTSMFTLLFTRPGETGYEFSECVQVEWESEGRVKMSLVRGRARRGLDRPGGTATITGDVTRPENARPAVEALLFQLADPGS